MKNWLYVPGKIIQLNNSINKMDSFNVQKRVSYVNLSQLWALPTEHLIEKLISSAHIQ